MKPDTRVGGDLTLGRAHQHEHAGADADGVPSHMDRRPLAPQDPADLERGEHLTTGAVDVYLQRDDSSKRPLRRVAPTKRFLEESKPGLVDDAAQPHDEHTGG